ncbi:KTSC domain-containing protein [Mucilaginibacter sp. 14171R-50]|uniref:KTSC domain-containing protein n=1 Tax=Mucilaginibacter sp. 14171R-50 TaxID=2703789 RepID=UPI00138D4F80|nr:KTSC domain-containing protein [Mucilaginibacter sp. 14171R-50]QHS54050.1 KTSC domain-containing protein [Mucilaginibacter sp. 14171R-50]
MRRQAVQSSALKSIGYDAEEHILELEFRENGDVWQYANVKPATYKRFLDSESRGNFFSTKIRGKYPEKKVSG